MAQRGTLLALCQLALKRPHPLALLVGVRLAIRREQFARLLVPCSHGLAMALGRNLRFKDSASSRVSLLLCRALQVRKLRRFGPEYNAASCCNPKLTHHTDECAEFVRR